MFQSDKEISESQKDSKPSRPTRRIQSVEEKSDQARRAIAAAVSNYGIGQTSILGVEPIWLNLAECCFRKL